MSQSNLISINNVWFYFIHSLINYFGQLFILFKEIEQRLNAQKPRTEMVLCVSMFSFPKLARARIFVFRGISSEQNLFLWYMLISSSCFSPLSYWLLLTVIRLFMITIKSVSSHTLSKTALKNVQLGAQYQSDNSSPKW